MLTITSLTRTCNWCPSQWEGKDDAGREVYIRFRHEWLTVDIDDVEILSEHHDINGGGEMSDAELVQILKQSDIEVTCEIKDKS